MKLIEWTVLWISINAARIPHRDNKKDCRNSSDEAWQQKRKMKDREMHAQRGDVRSYYREQEWEVG